MKTNTRVAVSQILRIKDETTDKVDEPKKKSREDWRKAKELEEARKASTAPAAVDETEINNTISDYPSSLESSTQETTCACSSELMKLRTKYERLRFKLIQTQAIIISMEKHLEILRQCYEELQAEITRWKTAKAILEENIKAERLAGERVEEKIQHLRARIDEREENADDQNANEDVMSLTDSENSAEETDPCNESWEPTFRKEDMNHSRMI